MHLAKMPHCQLDLRGGSHACPLEAEAAFYTVPLRRAHALERALSSVHRCRAGDGSPRVFSQDGGRWLRAPGRRSPARRAHERFSSRGAPVDRAAGRRNPPSLRPPQCGARRRRTWPSSIGSSSKGSSLSTSIWPSRMANSWNRSVWRTRCARRGALVIDEAPAQLEGMMNRGTVSCT